MQHLDRTQIADLMVARLLPERERLAASWQGSGTIRHCFIDDLLPEELAQSVYKAFPEAQSMRIRKTLRELKYVAAQMNEYAKLLEEVVFAFQDARIVDIVGQITALQTLEPDAQLYAGGISMMSQGHFLNPHIDNSHDMARQRYRVLNLLYYVSPGWQEANGGNLELWPHGVKSAPVTVESRFNRLALMITNQTSWHSVSPVKANASRCCVSNYYFSEHPADSHEYFHVTCFRGRPDQTFTDLALQADAALRMGVRKVFPQGLATVKHFYNKNSGKQGPG